MAVQAHYHLHQHHRESPFLASRVGGVAEGSRAAAPAMEMLQEQQETVMAPHQHPPLFLDFPHGDCGGGRKRQREAEAVAVSPPQFFSLQPQAQDTKMMGLDLLRNKRPATGLRLDFDEGSERVSSASAASASASCLISGEVAAQLDQCRNEMDRVIQEQGERLQRTLSAVRQRQYRSLLGAAEASAARRLKEIEAEASEAVRRGTEMEERIARLRAEALAWQAKALADQSTAAALHAQLQQVAAQAQAQARCKAEGGEGAADDAGSSFVDPDRVVEVAPPPPLARPCRACGRRSASVVLLPCRHLCVCAACGPAASACAPGAAACPMCHGAVTGAVQAFFS